MIYRRLLEIMRLEDTKELYIDISIVCLVLVFGNSKCTHYCHRHEQIANKSFPPERLAMSVLRKRKKPDAITTAKNQEQYRH